MEFYLLTGDSDATSVAHHIDRIQPDKVVSVGGDGTVKMVAELVKDTPMALGIIPAGSANGMARELEIPADVEAALDIIINGEEKKIDLVKINDAELCIHLSDIGLNAMLVKNFEKSGKRGMWGYGKTLLKTMWNKQQMHVTIHTDKEEVKRKAFMVVIANARKYGTGGNINPDGNVADGFFEIVVLRKIHLFEIIKGLLTDKSFNPERIEVFSTKKASLQTLKPTYFQVDGEYRGKVREVKAAILPACLRVMVPAAER